MGEAQAEHCQSSPDWDQTLSFQYPLRGAFWTFCSPKSRFSAVATMSGCLRSCSAKSRSLTTTVAGWVALMDFATVGGNPISECSKFLFPVSLLTLDSGLIGFQTPSGRNCDSDSGTSDHCAGPPV